MSKDNFFIFKDVITESDYLPLISFKKITQKQAVENYIIAEAKDFFKNILKINDEVIQIPYPRLITKHDFKTRDIKDFYNILFYDLEKRDSNRKLKINIKWGITFDEDCTPIQVGYYNHEENKIVYSDNRPNLSHLNYYRRYGTIDINGTPVFYYLYFTIKEIFDVIKNVS
ncbi:hypothetical protein L2E69_09030 [Planktothrix agardhii 1806]|jgi:hypothetical protein|uniref:hypothetical protein n=1 Tax=Planktothrix agardhii TaxID=1160 RepID=UPI001F1C4417|nr:hypothetical protein [Planktothrix agardhii]MCF3570780.1 hypothetical protein [Planktothrix agardhii 1805]MCF3586174.1 hypothetical protein [Planktothrix agardhii 1803]MCF3603002.1 hypothetical protein [Planktothrix agardhii 1804]MCF3616088.1 hypothetical protein [Planktothrix agardhii 1806]MCP9295564.1 hypothetical protein [Planktothrix agardhii LY1]